MVAFMFALLFDRFMQLRRLFYPTIGLLLLFVFCNVIALFQTNFLNNSEFTFSKRLYTAKQIVQESQGKEYNLIARGYGSQYISFTMNYQYLTWWLGHGPSKQSRRGQIFH